MSWLNSGLELIIGLFAVITIVAGAVVVARASYMREQLTGLRSDRDDLRARIQILTDELAIAEKEKQAAEEKARVLEQLATGKAQLDKIERLLDQFVTGAAEYDRKLFGILDEIREGVSRSANQ